MALSFVIDPIVVGACLTSSADSIDVSAVFVIDLILATPYTIFHNVSFFKRKALHEDNSKLYQIARAIVQLLDLLNYTINFFLYVFTSRQFRDGVVRKLGMLCFVAHLFSWNCLVHYRQYVQSSYNWYGFVVCDRSGCRRCMFDVFSFLVSLCDTNNISIVLILW
jgi:hypothetical protein